MNELKSQDVLLSHHESVGDHCGNLYINRTNHISHPRCNIRSNVCCTLIFCMCNALLGSKQAHLQNDQDAYNWLTFLIGKFALRFLVCFDSRSKCKQNHTVYHWQNIHSIVWDTQFWSTYIHHDVPHFCPLKLPPLPQIPAQSAHAHVPPWVPPPFQRCWSWADVCLRH